MKTTKVLFILALIVCAFVIYSCTNSNCCEVKTKTVVIYQNHSIPANSGISTGMYTNVDHFRYVNVVVEFQQDSVGENPVSLGVIFAHDSIGKWGSRRYFTFDENFTAPADPQMITLTGKNSWHGSQHKISAYIARLPIMGPYMQVFPFNHHSAARNITVALYLTE